MCGVWVFGWYTCCDDVLEMSVVPGMSFVCGLCEMCVFGSGRVGG